MATSSPDPLPTAAAPGQPHGGAVRPALWLLFAVLVLAGGWLFLRACGLDALGLDYCPARVDHRALLDEVAIGNDLDRQVHLAEMTVAEKPVCAPPPPPAPVTPAAPPAPVTPRPPPTHDPIQQKVTERGGKNGKLQFTLEWKTLDDLDLNVDCPGGRIDSQHGHAGPDICGDGVKDIDANRNLTENVSTTPIENIVWQNDIPAGTYTIEIIQYRASTALGNTVPFTLHMKWNDQERICKDAVSNLPQSVRKMDGSKVIGGTYLTIAWTYGTDLPDCRFQSHFSHRGANK